MQKRVFLFLFLSLLLLMCGCGQNKIMAQQEELTVLTEPLPSDNAAVSSPPEPAQPEKTACGGILSVKTMDDIKTELGAAMSELRQPRIMDVFGMDLSEHPELDVKNLYFALLSENRTYCYAYDLAAAINGSMLEAKISYMPYITGIYPTGFNGTEITSLTELIAVADANRGVETVNIRITNTSLIPDEMNRALQQSGGGYLIWTLNRDATAIICSPAIGFTMDECLEYLTACDEMAADIAAQCTTNDMERIDMARALYAYLSENVKYDHRYYSDKASMPYHSQTAYGAFYDGIAICGGYSHALKLLFEQADIPCYTVSGTWNGENHMWNIAKAEDEWVYFDATGDRGVSPEYWKYCAVTADELGDHIWEV